MCRFEILYRYPYLNTLKNYIKFNTQYDVSKLLAELEICLQKKWVDYFNTARYTGTWNFLPLFNRRNSQETSDSLIFEVEEKHSVCISQLPYIQSITDFWQCKLDSVRLMALYPESHIKPSQDIGGCYSDGVFRLQIPIKTNENLVFTVEGERLHLSAGECWYIDISKVHEVCNRGTESVVHLIIEGIRNKFTDQIFSDYGMNVNTESNYSEDSKKLMISELNRINTETARDIIKHLNEDL